MSSEKSTNVCDASKLAEWFVKTLMFPHPDIIEKIYSCLKNDLTRMNFEDHRRFPTKICERSEKVVSKYF